MTLVVFISMLFLPAIDNKVDKIYDKQFKSISKDYQEDDLIKQLVNLCSVTLDEEKRIKCVFRYLAYTIYNYEDHNDINLIRSPEEIFFESGNCRDYAVLYDSVFSSMGFKTEFVNEPNHIYNKIYFNNSSVIIDQDYIKFAD